MLILTRKAEQGIVIDSTITVRILSIDGDRVKIGIDAPPSINVLREELLDQTEEIKRVIQKTVNDAGGSIDAKTLGSQLNRQLTAVSASVLKEIIKMMISHGELIVKGEFITLKS